MNEEDQVDAYLEMLNRAGKFVIRKMSYPSGYLESLTGSPNFLAGHRTTPAFDTFEEASAHRATWPTKSQLHTKVVILTKDGGFTTSPLTEAGSYEGWPEVTTNARDMFVFANCVETIPYGSYVLMHDSCLRVHPKHVEQLKKDFLAAGKPTSQESIDRRGGRLKAPKWWTDDASSGATSGWSTTAPTSSHSTTGLSVEPTTASNTPTPDLIFKEGFSISMTRACQSTCGQAPLALRCELQEGHSGDHQVGGDDDRGLSWKNTETTIAQCIDDAYREVIGPEFTSAIRSPSQKLRALMEYCFMHRLNYGALSDLIRRGMTCLEQQTLLTTHYEKPSHGWQAKPRLEKESHWHYRIVLGNHVGEWAVYTSFAKLVVDGRTYVACSSYYDETFPEDVIFVVEELSP